MEKLRLEGHLSWPESSLVETPGWLSIRAIEEVKNTSAPTSLDKLEGFKNYSNRRATWGEPGTVTVWGVQLPHADLVPSLTNLQAGAVIPLLLRRALRLQDNWSPWSLFFWVFPASNSSQGWRIFLACFVLL